jgi:hypothetical protein
MNAAWRNSIRARSDARKKRSRAKSNSQSKGSACYICKQVGHHWKDCPVDKKRKESTAGKSERQQLEDMGKTIDY